MKYLLILMISFSALGEVNIKGEVKQHCLTEIIDVLKYTEKPSVGNDSVDPQVYRKIFLDESEKFCACVDKAFINEPKFFGISSYYINPELRFTKEDHCRHEHYKEGTFEVSTILAHKKIQEMVQDRIRDRYVRGIWLLASQESIARKFLCLEEKIHNKCFRTGSGGVSYYCVLNTMSDGTTMSKLDDDCPQFETVKYSSPVI